MDCEHNLCPCAWPGMIVSAWSENCPGALVRIESVDNVHITWLGTHIDEIDEVGASEAESMLDLRHEQHDRALVERQTLPRSALERGSHTAAQRLVRVLARQAAPE